MQASAGDMAGFGRRRFLGFALAGGVGAGAGLLPVADQASRALVETLQAHATAAERLAAAVEAYLAAPQEFVLDGQTIGLERRALGLTLAVEEHGGAGRLPWQAPELSVRASVDQATLLAALAARASLDRPPVDAALSQQGGEVVVHPERPGRRLVAEALATAVAEQARQLAAAPLAVPFAAVAPALSAHDLAGVAEWLRRAVARPLTIVDGERQAVLATAHLAEVLSVARVTSVVFDEQRWARALAPLAGDLFQAPVEPRLVIDDGQAMVAPAQPGRALDVAATAVACWAAVQASMTTVAAVMAAVPARLTAADLGPALASATRVLRRPPILVADRTEIPLTPAEVAPLLRGDGGGLAVDGEAARGLLATVAGRVAVAPQLPLFRWRDGAALPEGPGRPGRALAEEEAEAALVAGLIGGAPRVVLPLKETPVAVAASEVVPEAVLAEGRTYYGDSAPERYHNVALGLKRINGALIPPGGIFSFNAASGPVTYATGFRRGYGIAISNGAVTTVPSVGGGICQVATTVFHAAFRAGLPIIERSWHLYWMPRYGRPPSGMTGLDATVDDQSDLDFKFANSTEGWLLVEAVTEGGEAVVRLKGVPPTWQVAIDGPAISNVVRAPQAMIERPDPTLPRGTRVWVEHAQDGMRVAIHRRVRAADGRVLDDQTFVSRYSPANNVTLVGTGR